MNESSEFTEVDRLTSALFDGTISQDDFALLDNLLLKDADKRRRYLEIVRLESLLHWEAVDDGNTLTLSREVNKTISFPLLATLSSIAAILLAMAGSWWAFHHLSTNEKSFSETVYTTNSYPSLHPLPSEFKLSLTQASSIPVYESFALDLNPGEKSKELASRVLESLITGRENFQEGEFELIGPIKRWNRKQDLSVPAEKGILPASGSRMMALSPMMVDMDTQTAEVVETIQVLDVRRMLQLYKNFNGSALLSASVKFNQSTGEYADSTEYGITLSAFRGPNVDLGNALMQVENNSYTDQNSGNWSEVNSEMEIPTDTEFIVVSLSAKKSGRDVLLANSSSYYSDDLELSFSFGDKGKFGPI
jgi:hypothetical protein